MRRLQCPKDYRRLDYHACLIDDSLVDCNVGMYTQSEKTVMADSNATAEKWIIKRAFVDKDNCSRRIRLDNR